MRVSSSPWRCSVVSKRRLSLNEWGLEEAEAQVGRNHHRDERRREQKNSVVLVDHRRTTSAHNICSR